MGICFSKKKRAKHCKCDVDCLDQEIDRLQVQHHFYRHIWRSNFSSPIESVLRAGGAKVLDVGCGPATWLCDMAADFPKTLFTGVDILTVFPNLKPSNVQFVHCNLFHGLPFEDNTFDFVHMSLMSFYITEDQWSGYVIKELVRVLKPGGWLELMENNVWLENQGPTVARFSKTLYADLKARNLDPLLPKHLPKRMATIKELADVHHTKQRIPVGAWGGKIGDLAVTTFKGVMYHWMRTLQSNGFDEFITKYNDETNLYKSFAISNRFFAQKLNGAGSV